MTVFAAGAVLWREVDGQLMVALVHRTVYKDWAWAKGKLDPGEVLPQTAVREILEETG
ncbi:MAG: NUDIX domain-containing protein, partial [Micrococcales bacterium]